MSYGKNLFTTEKHMARYIYYNVVHTKQNALYALWAEGGWKLKLTTVHTTEYEIYGTKYLLV